MRKIGLVDVRDWAFWVLIVILFSYASLLGILVTSLLR